MTGHTCGAAWGRSAFSTTWGIDMTKKVRIENADGSNHHLVVQTWQKGADGTPDVLLKEEPLRNPTDMLDGWVWQGQYLVVVEKGADPVPEPPPTYCGMTATKTNHDKKAETLAITTPSGRKLHISSNLLVIDVNREGDAVAAVLEGEGVPFFRTRIIAGHRVKDARSSSTV